jgi:hypothetical protein
VTIKRSSTHPGLPGDLVKAGIGAKARKSILGRFQDALTVPLSVCTQLSLDGL